MPPAVLARRHTRAGHESQPERCLARVADGLGDPADAHVRRDEEVARRRHPPSGQVAAGVSPTADANRAANAERESPQRAARVGTDHGSPGAVWIAWTAGAITGSSNDLSPGPLNGSCACTRSARINRISASLLSSRVLAGPGAALSWMMESTAQRSWPFAPPRSARTWMTSGKLSHSGPRGQTLHPHQAEDQ